MPKHAAPLMRVKRAKVPNRPVFATAPSDQGSLTISAPETPNKNSEYIAGPYGSGRVSMDAAGALKPYFRHFLADLCY